MPEKINPYIRTKDQPKEKSYNGVIYVVDGIYKVGQWIRDNIFYAGKSTKEEHDALAKKLEKKKK